MTALEAYALAKKIAKSAVSGIKSLSVSGTTLYIETNDGNIIPMVFPIPADGRGITSTTIDSNGHLILTYDDGTTQDAGLIPGSNVTVTQILSHGTKIASINVNGSSTDLFAPEGGSGDSNYYIIDTLLERPSDLTSDDRRIYYCIETEVFYLWNGIEWSVISTNSNVIREITKEAYDALTPAEQMNGTIYFVIDEEGGGGSDDIIEGYYNTTDHKFYKESTYTTEIIGENEKLYISIDTNYMYRYNGSTFVLISGGGGGSADLTSDLTASVTVGGVNAGKTFTQGTSIETVVRNILSPTLYPTLTNPSVNITATGSKLLEKGGSLNTTVTTIFNRGSINPAYGTSGYRSGPATGYSLNNGTEQAGNTFAISVSESINNTLNVKVIYGAGEQPKDSVGQNYSTPLPAGNVNSNTITYEFVNAFWANTTSAATIEKQSLVSKSAKVKTFSFPATTATDPECFDVPADYTVTAVEVFNTLSSQWENGIGQFDISNVNHDDAGGTSTAYKRYSCNLGMSLGARQVRVKWL